MRLHHLPSYQFISQHKVDCNESLHGSCLHETSPVITNAKIQFGFRFGLKSTQTPVIWIHLSDFKGPSATFKNPRPSETHKNAHTDPGAVARRWVEQLTGERQTVCSGCLRHSSSSIVTLLHSSHVIISAAVTAQHSPENKHTQSADIS